MALWKVVWHIPVIGGIVVLVAILYSLQFVVFYHYYTSLVVLNENFKRREVKLELYLDLQDKTNKTSEDQRKACDSNTRNATEVHPSHSNNLLLLPSSLPESSSQSVLSNCSDYWCTSRLDTRALSYFKRCSMLYEYIYYKDPQTVAPKRCKFRRSEGHKPVALVSVPGSGNTWLRGLLELATGICTGSIYCDVPLITGGFIGEMVHDGSVLIIKTHTSDAQWSGELPKRRNFEDAYYTAAVVLIRNPFDTFVCERHRSILKEKFEEDIKKNLHSTDSSHVAEVGLEKFTNQSGWNRFVWNIAKRWQKTLLEWVTPGHPVLVIRYEDVKAKPLSVLEKVLIFLNFPEHLTDWKTRVTNGFDSFKRHQQTTRGIREYYSMSQILAINRMINSTATVLEKRGFKLKLKDYFMT